MPAAVGALRIASGAYCALSEDGEVSIKHSGSAARAIGLATSVVYALLCGPARRIDPSIRLEMLTVLLGEACGGGDVLETLRQGV
jgi:hypothetical protein